MIWMLLGLTALAGDTPSDDFEPWGDHVRRPAFEVNLLWPFFPGGIVDLKAMVPVARRADHVGRGELVLGLHSDFAWGFVRPTDEYGKVKILASKLGYRQFFAYGVHVDATVNLGWRHEVDNVHDGTTLDSLVARLWLMTGWQVDLAPRVYVNLRGGPGIHLWRTGDPYAHTEDPLAIGADLNLGLRF